MFPFRVLDFRGNQVAEITRQERSALLRRVVLSKRFALDVGGQFFHAIVRGLNLLLTGVPILLFWLVVYAWSVDPGRLVFMEAVQATDGEQWIVATAEIERLVAFVIDFTAFIAFLFSGYTLSRAIQDALVSHMDHELRFAYPGPTSRASGPFTLADSVEDIAGSRRYSVIKKLRGQIAIFFVVAALALAPALGFTDFYGTLSIFGLEVPGILIQIPLIAIALMSSFVGYRTFDRYRIVVGTGRPFKSSISA